jgi:hypothetical protein
MKKIMSTYFRLLHGDLNYGLKVKCFVCDKPHKALHGVRIEADDDRSEFPLCTACHDADDENGAVMRKFLNAPKLKITHGGQWDPAWDKKQ